MKLFRKITISFLLSVLLLVTFITPVAYAQTQGCEGTWYCQDFDVWAQKVYSVTNPNEIFGERYTAAQVEWIIYSLFAFVIQNIGGPRTRPLFQCLLANINDPAPACAGLVVQAIADSGINKTQMYALDLKSPDSVFSTDKLSGVGYLRGKIQKLNGGTEVHAQSTGFGFNGLNSIQRLWVSIRNLAYFFLVITMVIMAFMIMFRVKLNPQTVITVQSAVPKLFVALILITFSYAIAGFMIDLMYVAIGLIAAIFRESQLFVILNVGGSVAGPVSWQQMFSDLSGLTFGLGLLTLFISYLIWFAIAVIGVILHLDILSFIFGVILWVIAIFVCLFLFFKIGWMLLKNFFLLLVNVALGPLIILGGAIGIGGVANWLKSLVSILAVYAAVGPMFAIAFFFLANAAPDWGITAALSQTLARFMPFSPNPTVLSGNTWVPPFLSGQNMDMVWLIASLVILTLIPKVDQIIKGAISGRPFALDSAIGEGIGAGTGFIAGQTYNGPIGREIRGAMSTQGAYNVATGLMTGRRIGGRQIGVESIGNWYSNRFGKNLPGMDTLKGVRSTLQYRATGSSTSKKQGP